jgi:tetratricopeptide (TPR) repeat protein
LYEAVASTLHQIANLRPAVVVLDDLHCADAPSLGLLEHLARRPDQAPEGNPFFVEEVVAHLIETGTELHAAEGLQPDQVAKFGIPEGIREVIGRRLSRLSEAANRTLALAAVIGREFDIELLQAVSDSVPDQVLNELGEALTARILSDAASQFGHSAFSHALIRQTLLEELTPTRRARLHRRVAEALELAGGSPGELALHWSAAHDLSRALQASVAAAQLDEALLAFVESRRHYETAIDLWGEVAAPQELTGWDLVELLRRAAEISYLVDGGLERAMELARRAQALAEAGSDPTRSGVIAERLGRYGWLAVGWRPSPRSSTPWS